MKSSRKESKKQISYSSTSAHSVGSDQISSMGNMSSDEMTSGKMEVTYCGFDIAALPEELLMHVLMFVPAKDLRDNCRLVCKHWRTLCKNQILWRRKCEVERKYVPGLMGPPPDNFVRFYFYYPYTRNLLLNAQATNGLRNWKKGSNSWTNVEVEDKPAGANPIRDSIPSELIEGDIKNWVTSYRYAGIQQEVRLLDLGCAVALLDEVKPPIRVSVWCAARWDCGAKFDMKVKLRNSGGKALHTFEKEMDLSDGALRKVWHKMEHTFTDYESGVRSIVFHMGGVDTQFWAGNYGPKFTLPCVRFVFNQ